MKHIYNELRSHQGKLTEFGNVLVANKLFANSKNAIANLRNGVKERKDIQALYDEWKHGRFKTKDVSKYNDKVSQVFKDIKRKTVKQELTDIRDCIEEALMCLTMAIKRNDTTKLNEVKEMLQNALYGGNNV